MVENQIWFDPMAKKCLQWLYEDLMARFEPNFDPMTIINLQRLFDHLMASLTKKKKFYKYPQSIPFHT